MPAEAGPGSVGPGAAIDDPASVDVEVAWEQRSQAERAVADAEVAATAAIDRLVAEKLAIKDVVHLTSATR